MPREGRTCGCFQRVRFASGSSSPDLDVGLWPPKEITSPSPQSVLLHRFQGRGLGNHTTGRKTIKRCGLHVLSLLGVLEPHILRNQPSQHHCHCAIPPFSESCVAVGCVSKEMIIPAAATKSVQKLLQRSGPPSEGLVRLPLLSSSWESASTGQSNTKACKSLNSSLHQM